MTDTVGTASVTLIRENEDGSADYQFNFPPEALAALTRLGILTAIQAGIAEARHLNPDTPPPKQWVGLTDEEVLEIIDGVIGFNSCWGPEEDFAQAIEAKLKEKNT